MSAQEQEFVLFVSIFDTGKGSEGLRLANRNGAFGSVVLRGTGTVSDEILGFLGITETRREILMTIAPKEIENSLFDAFVQEFHFDQPHHGIAFSMSGHYFFKKDGPEYKSNTPTKGVTTMDYEAIYVIVNKGLIDDVIEVAQTAGATGGTVLHGRGTSKAERVRFFNIDIEPEKEILMILAQTSKAEGIIDAIRTELELEKHGKGILFSMDVGRTVGLYNGEEA